MNWQVTDSKLNSCHCPNELTVNSKPTWWGQGGGTGTRWDGEMITARLRRSGPSKGPGLGLGLGLGPGETFFRDGLQTPEIHKRAPTRFSIVKPPVNKHQMPNALWRTCAPNFGVREKARRESDYSECPLADRRDGPDALVDLLSICTPKCR